MWSRQDDRFRAAAAVWRKLAGRWIQILPDDVTPELATVIQRVSGLPMAERMKRGKDLGEIMVIAHAVVAAESGQPVTVLMMTGAAPRSQRPKSRDCSGWISADDPWDL
jgi:hypothetical protein